MKTTNKVSYTPAPWQIAPNEVAINGYFREIQKPNGFPTGILIESIDEKASSPTMVSIHNANAAFIVRAVNSHDTMLQALKDLVRTPLNTFAVEAALKVICEVEGK